jgi:hypothetical protein
MADQFTSPSPLFILYPLGSPIWSVRPHQSSPTGASNSNNDGYQSTLVCGFTSTINQHIDLLQHLCHQSAWSCSWRTDVSPIMSAVDLLVRLWSECGSSEFDRSGRF